MWNENDRNEKSKKGRKPQSLIATINNPNKI